MANAFDPYHRWLGIPAEEQPAHHYRLLGVRAFETDPDVIQNAVDQRMAHLRNFQAGQYAELCAKILNELSAAKVCLLSPERKSAYDEQLRRDLAAKALPPLPRPAIPRAAPAPPPAAAPPLPAGSGADSGLAQLFGQVPGGASSVTSRVAGRRRSSTAVLMGWGVVAMLVVAAVVMVLQSARQGGDRAVLVFEWPDDLRANLQIKLDDQELTVPPSGTWEHPCEPGPHHVSAILRGYEPLDQRINLEAGQRCIIGLPARVAGGPAASTSAKTRPKERPTGAIAMDQWVDLLPWVELRADRVDGAWSKSGEVVRATKPGDYSRLMLPAALDGADYELEVAFTRTEGTDMVFVVLPAGPRQFVVGLSVHEGQAAGVEMIDGKSIGEIAASTRPGALTNGQRYTLVVRVELKDNDARIGVVLDGKPYLQWSGAVSSLSLPKWAVLPDPRRPALGSNAAAVTYHAARLRVVSGRANWAGHGAGTPSAQPTPPPPAGELPVEVAGMKPAPFAVAGVSMPEYFRGATAFDFAVKPGTDVKNGVLQFSVKKPCSVALLATWRREGSPRGGWEAERLTREQLAAQGWTDLGPAPWDKELIVLHRQCRAGESYRLRTNKYWPPRLVLLAPGAKVPDPPEREPETAVATKPPDEGTKPPDDKPRERLPIPPEEEQKRVLAQLEDIYKLGAASTAEQKRKLAADLLTLSDDSTDRPIERYVILRTAAQMAAEGGDADALLKAAGALGEGFQGDVLEFKAKALEAMGNAAMDAASIRALVAAADQVIDEAQDAGRYDLGAALADLAYRACQKPQGRDLRKQTLDRQRQIQAMFASWKLWQDALAGLKNNPDDPQANLAAGRWYCLNASDWEKGLPHLAKGADDRLKSLSSADLAAAPADSTARVRLADDWFDAAQTAADPDKRLMLLRARQWYKEARAGELSSLTGLKVAKRLEEIASALESGASEPGARRSP